MKLSDALKSISPTRGVTSVIEAAIHGKASLATGSIRTTESLTEARAILEAATKRQRPPAPHLRTRTSTRNPSDPTRHHRRGRNHSTAPFLVLAGRRRTLPALPRFFRPTHRDGAVVIAAVARFVTCSFLTRSPRLKLAIHLTRPNLP